MWHCEAALRRVLLAVNLWSKNTLMQLVVSTRSLDALGTATYMTTKCVRRQLNGGSGKRGHPCSRHSHYTPLFTAVTVHIRLPHSRDDIWHGDNTLLIVGMFSHQRVTWRNEKLHGSTDLYDLSYRTKKHVPYHAIPAKMMPSSSARSVRFKSIVQTLDRSFVRTKTVQTSHRGCRLVDAVYKAIVAWVGRLRMHMNTRYINFHKNICLSSLGKMSQDRFCPLWSVFRCQLCPLCQNRSGQKW